MWISIRTVSRSRISTCIGDRRVGALVGVVALACLAACVTACHRPAAIAELTKADGAVEREAQNTAWAPAALGTQYFLGDAARTNDGSATLLIGGASGAQLRMQKHTVIRFGGKPGASKIAVEVGAIDLSGTGSYGLDVGDLRLADRGGVRISARGDGTSQIELTVGRAELAARGQTFELTVGQPIGVGADAAAPIAPIAQDAGVVDAPAVAVVDAGVTDAPAEVGGATIEITGARGELLAPGATAWQPLPEGAGAFAEGSAVRLGAGTTAKLTQAGTTLELAGGARAKLDADRVLWIEAGDAQARASEPATVRVPGGEVALAVPGHAGSEARVDVNPRDSKVTMLRGGAKLTGAPGAELALTRGESALITRAGALRVIEAIPSYFDFRFTVGESFTVHDPKPPTAIQFAFDGKCGDGGIIELDRDPRFRTAKVSSGKDVANLLIGNGSWAYRLRCTTNGSEGAAVASGRISVVRDDGRRPLPKNQGSNDIDADGRNYRISYQSAIPNVVVHLKNPGSANKLHLAAAGKEQTFDSSASSITVLGTQLHEGTYTYWVDRDGVKQEKISTLVIDFDQTAPQVYIESPSNGQAWAGDLDVRGAVLPGWSAAVESVPIPVDKQRRFAATVSAPAGSALAIRLSHPQHGVHYYLRRQK
jgi:hypothetical protein